MLRSDDTLTRRGAVRRLAGLPLALGSHEVIVALIKRARHDKDAYVRRESIVSMGLVSPHGHSEVVKALCDVAVEDKVIADSLLPLHSRGWTVGSHSGANHVT